MKRGRRGSSAQPFLCCFLDKVWAGALAVQAVHAGCVWVWQLCVCYEV